MRVLVPVTFCSNKTEKAVDAELRRSTYGICMFRLGVGGHHFKFKKVGSLGSRIMSDNRVQQITAVFVLLIQSWQIPTGAYAGLSGLDSLAQLMCTLVDQTVGIFLFCGLFTLCFFPGSERIGLSRMNMIHTTRPAEMLKFTLIPYRARWRDVGNLGSRSGYFTVESTNGSQQLDTTIAPK
ncbi:hypothetical protein D9757_004483 [Collybiopsis confluens]|uniref:Uncharacterized protein n=1 Tax=Collybiopsis confluens TaxID=2823264 RepID=A0A8H5HWD0_9AGAR|nr:hypothetical protein D9757_004483 [Collybiopsis confluens]